MSKRHILKGRIPLAGLLAIAAALAIATPRSADARVFFGVGLGFPVFGFGVPYAYPPPAYYYPPPVVYAPPPFAYAPPPVSARCLAVRFACPLRFARPVGAACGCPDAYGRYIRGRVG